MEDQSWLARIMEFRRNGRMLVLSQGSEPKVSIPATALRAALIAGGEIDPSGLRICGARFTGHLHARHITLDYPLHLEFCAFDEVLDFSGAKLRELSIRSSTLPSLVMDRAVVEQGLFAPHLQCDGVVNLSYAQIGNQANFQDAKINVFAPPGTPNQAGPVLLLDGISIIGSFFANRLTVRGEVRATDSEISGQLNFNNARLLNNRECAFRLSGLKVARLLLKETSFHGSVSIINLISQNLDMQLAENDAADSSTVTIRSSVINRLDLRVAAGWTGLDLQAATVDQLDSPTDVLPVHLSDASGWTIKQITGLMGTNASKTISWLKSAQSTAIQPWEAIAEYYERAGMKSEANRIRHAGARRVTKQAPIYVKPFRYLFAMAAGYGYWPVLSGLWLIASIVLAIYIVGMNSQSMVPTDNTRAQAAVQEHSQLTGSPQPATVSAELSCEEYSPYPCFSATTYTVGSSVPGVGAASKQDWTVSSSAPGLTLAVAALRIAAWIFSAILIASLTGLLRRG